MPTYRVTVAAIDLRTVTDLEAAAAAAVVVVVAAACHCSQDSCSPNYN